MGKRIIAWLLITSLVGCSCIQRADRSTPGGLEPPRAAIERGGIESAEQPEEKPRAPARNALVAALTDPTPVALAAMAKVACGPKIPAYWNC